MDNLPGFFNPSLTENIYTNALFLEQLNWCNWWHLEFLNVRVPCGTKNKQGVLHTLMKKAVSFKNPHYSYLSFFDGSFWVPIGSYLFPLGTLTCKDSRKLWYFPNLWNKLCQDCQLLGKCKVGLFWLFKTIFSDLTDGSFLVLMVSDWILKVSWHMRSSGNFESIL